MSPTTRAKFSSWIIRQKRLLCQKNASTSNISWQLITCPLHSLLCLRQLILKLMPPNTPTKLASCRGRLGKPHHKNIAVHLGIARLGGGSKPLPGWFVAPREMSMYKRAFAWFCPKIGGTECPFECGGGVQWLFGQCPNELLYFYVGASLQGVPKKSWFQN